MKAQETNRKDKQGRPNILIAEAPEDKNKARELGNERTLKTVIRETSSERKKKVLRLNIEMVQHDIFKKGNGEP